MLRFTAVRHLTDDELDMVETAQASVEAKRYVQFTAAAVDGVKKLPPAMAAPVVQQAAPKGPQFADEDAPEDAPEAEPAPVKKPVQKAAPKVSQFADEDEPAPVEPVKRVSKKAEPDAAPKKNLADVVSAWAED